MRRKQIRCLRRQECRALSLSLGDQVATFVCVRLQEGRLLRGFVQDVSSKREAVGSWGPLVVALSAGFESLFIVFVLLQVAEVPRESQLARRATIGGSRVSIASRIEGVA